MKRLLPLLVLALLPVVTSVRAADESLITEEDTWNLYTKLAPSWCDLGSDNALWGTVEVGGILNDGLALGLRATTLLDDASPGFEGSDGVDQFDATVVGLSAEYTLFSESLVHGSLSLFVGGGTMKLSGNDDEDVDLLVLEPAVNIMVNVTQASEVGLGLGYRAMDPDGAANRVSSSDLSGLDLSIFLRLTEF